MTRTIANVRIMVRCIHCCNILGSFLGEPIAGNIALVELSIDILNYKHLFFVARIAKKHAQRYHTASERTVVRLVSMHTR